MKSTVLSLCFRLIEEIDSAQQVLNNLPAEDSLVRCCMQSAIGYMLEACALVLSDLMEPENEGWYDFGDAPETIGEAVLALPSFLESAQGLLREELASDNDKCPIATVQMRVFTYMTLFKIAGDDYEKEEMDK